MNFQTYLDAKRTVDDRALNRRILHQFSAELPESARILEIGAGIGTMVERLHSWERLPRRTRYTALDIDPENIAAARKRLLANGFESHGDGLRIDDGERRLTVSFEVADAIGFAARTDERWDALVGHAVLDLFDLESALPSLLSALEPGGICYFPITFDGGTTFDPPHPLDSRVERLYHEHMGDSHGSSDAGRRLLAALRARETDVRDRGESGTTTRVLAAGGSDWVVFPQNGSYPGNEARFLRYILETIGSVLDECDPDRGAFAEWRRTRRRQIERGDLVYVAHQLDVLGKRE
ncbi:class I SAM-dependent methyltransferase [Haladaptatus sp.]|uniref:class I SAM-dependent methyltransferase n=1 Tax=Haladaptatus sp. TaxID=1973141 RepID=UPI003C684019